MDRKSYSETLTHNVQATAYLKQYMEDNDIIDIWCTLNPETKKYTWTRYHPDHLDFWLVDLGSTQLVVKTDIKPGYLTDHTVITLRIQCADDVRGKGYWKINNSLLEDSDYHEEIVRTIDEAKIEM